MTPQLAKAFVPGDTTTYNLGSGDTAFWANCTDWGYRAFSYTYTHQEQGLVDATGETLSPHENIGQYYRDQYLGQVGWGPISQGGNYSSNGIAIARIISYQPITMYLRSGWAEWGGDSYTNVRVSSTVGARTVQDFVTFGSDEWVQSYTMSKTYTF